MLEEINRRIDETEAKLLQLDQEQLLNRLDWADWGIDLLQKDIKEMEKEIRERRKKWEEMRRSNLSSEQAWREWERVGRELDLLDKKKERLYSTLERLKYLRDKIRERIKEIKGIYEPKPFALGLGIGSLTLKNKSTQVFELKLRTPFIDLFYGSDGNENTPSSPEGTQLSYFGGEISLGKIQYWKNWLVYFPIGFEKLSTEKGISLCAGVMGEFRYRNANQEWTSGFLQIRYGVGKSILTLLIGIFF